MGAGEANAAGDGARHRALMGALLRDLEAFDRMIREGRIESGVHRAGAEQELVLVDGDGRPAGRAEEMLREIRAGLGELRVINEVARFNLELNLTPVELGPGMMGRFEGELRDLLALVERVAAGHGCRAVMAGILPTIELRDLGPPNMMPHERYQSMDEAVRAMRGRDYELHIKGADELAVRFPSIMLEAVNTSFQVHLQVGAEEFARMYNLAQLLAGPVLAACANSPLLFGRRLWQETRVAIFEQAVDTRRLGGAQREAAARVRFGDGWLRSSATELFRSDIARQRLLFGAGGVEDSLAVLDAGGVPMLQALAMHNGTVYRWNRPCYGITNGRPHLRIESRYLPAGPTVVDEMANAALWIGAMLGGVEAFGDFTASMPFQDAATNFVGAARLGLGARLTWIDGNSHDAQALVLDEILPAARAGLASAGLEPQEIGRYLGVIEARVAGGRTGAEWQLRSFAALWPRLKRGRAIACITSAMTREAAGGEPVHTWAPVDPEECATDRCAFCRVGQVMSTNLCTVREDELVELVARIMEWEEIRHVLVEDAENRLVGIITWRQVLRHLSARGPADVGAAEIMRRNPVSAAPDMSTVEAIALMQDHGLSALPVVEEGRLVGIVTERDFTRIAGELLEERREPRHDRTR